jgi:hypothetical protein
MRVSWPLPFDATDFGAFQSQVVHQTFLIKNESDDGARDTVGVDRAADPDGDDGDGTVDTHFPAVRRLKLREGLFGHEHDDHRARLRPELKADRARNGVVIPGCLAADFRRPFPVFAADAEAGLHHGREHEYRHRSIGERVRKAHLPEELIERYPHLRLDLGPRCGLARRGCPGRREYQNKQGKTACSYSQLTNIVSPPDLFELLTSQGSNRVPAIRPRAAEPAACIAEFHKRRRSLEQYRQ